MEFKPGWNSKQKLVSFELLETILAGSVEFTNFRRYKEPIGGAVGLMPTDEALDRLLLGRSI